MTGCPGEDPLLAMLDGALTGDALAVLEVHLDGCPSCRELSAALVRDRLPPSAPAPRADGPALAYARGDSVGRYRILDELGRGGAGVVYAAQDPSLDRKVALKLLRSGSPELQDLLLAEAQTTARLAHPNVVTIYDVGEVDGQIYLAMELLEGGSLRSWRERRSPGRKELLRAVLLAGRGLEAAHRAGLVHADFKPDNVLISGSGDVRVTDFGLARTAGSASRTSGGTPAYLAPEQRAGAAPSEQSDQYSFCVTAAELLTGRRPDPDGELGEAAAALKGPLRKILERGLRSDPSQRYPSLAALLTELARVVTLARRRWIYALTASAALAGAGGVVHQRMSTEEALCGDGPARLDAAWNDRTREEITQAFLRTGLDYAQDSSRGALARVETYATAWRQEFARACSETRLTQTQPEEVWALRRDCLELRRGELEGLLDIFAVADARTVELASRAAASLAPVADCVDVDRLRLHAGAASTPGDRAVRRELEMELARASSHTSAGRLSEGRRVLDGLLPRARAAGHPVLLARVLDLIAQLQSSEGNEEADRTWSEALLAAERGGDDRAKIELALHQIRSLTDRDLADQALERIEQARATLGRLGRDPELEAKLQVSHGMALSKLGRYDEALTELKAGHQGSLRLGRPSTELTGAALGAMGMISMRQGKLDEADRLYRESLSIFVEEAGKDHPWAAYVGAILADVALMRAEYAQAESGYRVALRSLEQSMGKEHHSLASMLNNLALALDGQDKTEEAVTTVMRARDIVLSSSEDSALRVTLEACAARFLARAGRCEEARPFLTGTIERLGRKGPLDPFNALTNGTSTVEALVACGRPAEALALSARTLARAREHFPSGHPLRAEALRGQGVAQLANRRWADSLRSLQEAVPILEASGLDPVGVPVMKLKLAQALWGTGRRQEGVALAEEAGVRLATARWQRREKEELERWLSERRAGPRLPASR